MRRITFMQFVPKCPPVTVTWQFVTILCHSSGVTDYNDHFYCHINHAWKYAYSATFDFTCVGEPEVLCSPDTIHYSPEIIKISRCIIEVIPSLNVRGRNPILSVKADFDDILADFRGILLSVTQPNLPSFTRICQDLPN